ncbi:MAG: two-component sensor histidine kinase, partial [Kaistella sp.]
MNNKFIPFISVLMTISMIVFVTLQLYWIKELYSALNQDFSNKVYSSLESAALKTQQLEVDKYLNQEYKNFGKNIIDSSNLPTQTYIQQNSDSANRSTITFQKSIVES